MKSEKEIRKILKYWMDLAAIAPNRAFMEVLIRIENEIFEKNKD